MPSIISNTQSLRAGVQAELKDFWRQKMPVYQKQQALFLRQLPDTNLRNVPYVFKESLPFPKLWPYGKGRTYQAFQDRILYMNTVPYDLTISWSEWDERDDQLGDLKQHVQSAVNRYGMLPDRLIAEYLNGAASLNPSLLTAYDGAAIVSATDGDGAARFGATGGNIVTGSGLSPAAIVHDLAVAQQRFLSFLDPTAKLPIFDADEAAYSKLECVIPKTLNEIFQKASESEYIKLDGSLTMAEGNYMKGKFTYHINQYLTDTSDWYVIMNHSFWKPFIQRAPGKIENVIADSSNSDRAREYKENAMFTDLRTRIGPLFPGVIIKINL